MSDIYPTFFFYKIFKYYIKILYYIHNQIIINMTQKEKLIREYFSLKHDFDINEGDNALAIFPAEPSNEDIYTYSREFKVINLQDKINAVKDAIERQKEKIKIKKYFETPEGIEYKNSIETKLKSLSDTYKAVEKSYIDKLTTLVNDFLGSNFTSDFWFNYKSCRGEIGIINNDKDHTGFTFKFGHSFNVSYDNILGNYNKETHTYDHEYKLEVNYSTLGAFDVINDTDRINYIAGFGKFVSATNIKLSMVELMKTGISRLNEISNEIDKFENMLKNPKF